MKRYIVQTFGCQMNVHDSRRIEEVLHGDGYVATDDATLADLIVVNTCSVREKAEHKLMSLLGTLRILKEQRPGVGQGLFVGSHFLLPAQINRGFYEVRHFG